MPTFQTPDPILATLELPAGHARIAATDRADTVVEVRPGDPADDRDVHAATHTRVEYADGRLLIKAPKRRSWFGRIPAIEVTVALPSGSQVDGRGAADFDCEGRLSEATISTSGEVRLDDAGRLRLTTGAGDISVGRASGRTEATTASGEVRIARIDGPAVIKTAHGRIALGEVTGELQTRTASGEITVERAAAGVSAKAAHGDITIGEVVRGSVVVETAYGNLELGVADGTAAWLDVVTGYGSVRRDLDPCDRPGQAEGTVEIRGRTAYGDIFVHKA